MSMKTWCLNMVKEPMRIEVVVPLFLVRCGFSEVQTIIRDRFLAPYINYKNNHFRPVKLKDVSWWDRLIWLSISMAVLVTHIMIPIREFSFVSQVFGATIQEFVIREFQIWFTKPYIYSKFWWWELSNSRTNNIFSCKHIWAC